MRQRKKRHYPKMRMPKRIKIFIIRAAASLLIFSCLAAGKYFVPGLPFYVKNQISYNANLESAKATARNVILKYSPTSFLQAEN